MRHHSSNRKFGRIRKTRKALLRSLALAVILKGGINTTEAKAKEIRPLVEKLVTLAKKGTIASRRLITSRVSLKASDRLFKEIAPRFKKRSGGYIRIVKLPVRKSDGAKMAMIEFLK